MNCAQHLSLLKDDMKARFSDLVEIQYDAWVTDLVAFDVIGTENLDPEIAGELLELKENEVIMAELRRHGIRGWLKVQQLHPLLFSRVEPLLLSFPTTWLVEAGFSAVNKILTKKRNALDIEKRGDLRLKLNASILVNIDKLVAKHQLHTSH